MNYIVEVHNRPEIRERWIERSEPDFDFWFTINVEQGKPVFRAMQEKALKIVNERLSGNYEPKDLAILNRTIDKSKISRSSLNELNNGEVLSYLLLNWNGHKYVS